jgi:CBS domain-containing protein
MITVRDVMTADVLSVSPELTLRELLETLATRRLSGVPVLASGQVVGVVSGTDLLEFAWESPAVPTERPNVPELEEWQSPEEWEEGAEPPGAFYHELWADVGADVLERFAEPASPEWDALAEHTVAEVMTRAPLRTVRAGAGLAAAARRMLRAGVHRLLVTEDGRLVGVLAMTDIVRAVAEHRLGDVPGDPATAPRHSRRRTNHERRTP